MVRQAVKGHTRCCQRPYREALSLGGRRGRTFLGSSVCISSHVTSCPCPHTGLEMRLAGLPLPLSAIIERKATELHFFSIQMLFIVCSKSLSVPMVSKYSIIHTYRATQNSGCSLLALSRGVCDNSCRF